MIEGRAEVEGAPAYRAGQSERGCFSTWSWDGSTLTARNDRYGFRALFYAESAAGEIVISPSLVRLLEKGAPAEFDDEAMAVFLRLGFFIGEDTPFKSIRALPPGARLEWHEGVLHLRGGLFIVPEQSGITRDEATEGYAQLFREALARCPVPEQTECALPLSAGRDSRHILLELCESGRKPSACLTLKHFPPRTNEDAELAAEVSKAVGVEHILLNQSPSRLQAELRKNLLTHFCADEHAWYLPLADYVKGRWPLIYDGIAGDVLSAGLFLDEARLTLFRQGNFAALADNLLETEGYLPGLLSEEMRGRWGREAARARLCAELTKHASAANPVGSFYFWNRTRREIALSTFNILGASAEVATPYLDTGVYDFLASLPAAFYLDHDFHTETILRAYPRFAHLAFEEKHDRRLMDARHFRRFARELMSYALHHRASKLVRSSFLAPRITRCLLGGDYSESVTSFGPLAVYLLQLEEASRRGEQFSIEPAENLQPLYSKEQAVV
jgi:asparagine synthase (glutamine-hydrolysing)